MLGSTIKSRLIVWIFLAFGGGILAAAKIPIFIGWWPPAIVLAIILAVILVRPRDEIVLIFFVLTISLFVGGEIFLFKNSGPANRERFSKFEFRKNVNQKNRALSLIKEAFTSATRKMLPPPYSEITGSLLLGDTTSPVSEDIKEIFIKSGLIHLLVASGTQIAILINSLAWILNLFKLPKFIKTAFIFFGSLFISALTGFGSSILRAMFMAQLGAVGQLLDRRNDGLNLLSGAGLILLVLNPPALFDIGFQLSFAASFSLIYLLPCWTDREKDRKSKLTDLILLALLPVLTTAPIIAYYFNRLNPAAVIANIFVLPWIEFLICLTAGILILAVLLPGLAPVLGWPVFLGLKILLLAADFFSRMPGSQMLVKSPSLITIFVYYSTLIGLSVWRVTGKETNRIKKIRLAALILLPIFLMNIQLSAPVYGPDKNSLSLTILDVGEAEAILLQSPSGKNILIDAGGQPENFLNNKSGDKIYRKTLQQLARLGIRKLDLAIISHPDSDHLGGLPAILNEMPVSGVVDSGLEKNSEIYRRFRAALARNNIPRHLAGSGDRITIDRNIFLYFLYPPKNARPPKSEITEKNQSLVLKVVYGNFSALLTGDLEQPAEQELLKKNFDLRAEVLKVPHHGSRTSTGGDFLNKVHPRTAVISVGRKNKFHHPHPAVIDRLKKMGIKIFRTDQLGSIIIKSDGQHNYRVFTSKDLPVSR